jgi:hypothetical protein
MQKKLETFRHVVPTMSSRKVGCYVTRGSKLRRSSSSVYLCLAAFMPVILISEPTERLITNYERFDGVLHTILSDFPLTLWRIYEFMT